MVPTAMGEFMGTFDNTTRPSAEFQFSHTLVGPPASAHARPLPIPDLALAPMLELASNFAPVVAERNLPSGQTEPKMF
eukprot:maker-scaffold243_size241480-snap-gene-1.19 protein:Tk02959 transcript:maker-scaffold243_size241480-snap-gene-1.19-mRNA-1 annotation:"transcriptional regulator"